MTATMAVFTCPRFTDCNIRHKFSLLKQRRFTNLSASSSLRQIKCSAKSDRCVVDKQGISVADEEDYVKAGGSELFFVQMQRTKSMESQSKLSEKVNYSITILVLITRALCLFVCLFVCFLVSLHNLLIYYI